MKRFVLLVGWLMCWWQVSAQPRANKGKEAILFTVANQPTTAEEFEYIYRKNNQGRKDEFTEEKIREYLELFIQFKLKVHEAQQRGMDTTRAFLKEFKSYRDELKKPYIASADELDRLVKEAYERLKQEVRASHILINCSPDATPEDTLKAYNKALALRERALKGESFATLATENSEDPSAKMNQGSLGYFTALQMVYPFESAAYQTGVGEISMPVRTRFGYHVISVADKRPASGEVEVSHILLRGADARTKDKAFDVYDQLKAGRPWEELCREFSDDAATKENGGKLRPFGVGALASVPEFEAVAFSLKPGEVSDPFQSNIGWHLVRLEKKIQLPPYEELAPSLKRRVGRDERLQISKASQLARRKKEFNYVENTTVKSTLLDAADTSLQRGRWQLLKTRPDAEATLFSLNGTPARVGAFYQFVAEAQRPSALPPEVYFQNLYDQFLEDQIGDREDEQLQQQNADYRHLLREYREGILLFSIMEKEVWNKGSEDTTGQRLYYNRHADKYRAGERVRARILASNDAGLMKELKQKIMQGDTLNDADLKKLKIALNPRAYEKGENKAIDRVTWAAGLHETDVEGMYYLVEIERLLPAGTQSFDEARANIISDYQQEIERQWVSGLRKKYPVKENKKVVKATVANLRQL